MREEAAAMANLYCALQMMEAVQQQKLSLSLDRGHAVYKHILIIDLQGLQSSLIFNRDVRGVMKHMITSMSDGACTCYPCSLFYSSNRLTLSLYSAYAFDIY